MSTSNNATDGNPADWITPAEAARLRGCSRQAIGSLIRRGRLQTLQFGGKTFVRRSEVESFVGEVGGRGKKALSKKQSAQKKPA
jgi:excisionase family DNA binding protein